jgi:hypothetical protein
LGQITRDRDESGSEMTGRDERLEAVVNTLLRLGSTFDDIFPMWSHRQVAQVISASYDAIRAFDEKPSRSGPHPHLRSPTEEGPIITPQRAAEMGNLATTPAPAGADPPWLDEAAKAAHDAAGLHSAEEGTDWFHRLDEGEKEEWRRAARAVLALTAAAKARAGG